MPKRLAITISGAVSLGSYEAGVLYEIIHAIGRHNEHPETNEAEKIAIDVLTGASAGGMTATIAAQKLLYEAGATEGAYSNAFYLPWVADVSLEALLTLHGTDDPTKSILSSELVIELSRRYLTARYASGGKLARVRHPAAAPVLHLGLALANLNGLDFGLPLRPEGQFIYTSHQDQLALELDAKEPAHDRLEVWEPLRNTAVSCGAFPFAFRVIDVWRQNGDRAEAQPGFLEHSGRSFACTDGGTFQNEPLGLAKQLVDHIDHHLDVENRAYLFIAHGPKGSTANSEFNATQANFRNTALRLVSAVFDQARFQDWIMAEKVNAQVALFNQRAEELRRFLSGKAPESRRRAKMLQQASDALLPQLFVSGPPGQAPAETIERARARLTQQFQTEYRSLPAATREAWLDCLLTLERAANLAARDEMTIFGITADHTELAGAELCAFAGFFDRRYRDHDYDVGRQKAQEFLGKPAALGPIHYTPEPLRPIDRSLNGLKLEQMDRSLRERVRDRLRERVHEVLKEAGVSPWVIGGAVREAIDLVFIKPQLEKLLKL